MMICLGLICCLSYFSILSGRFVSISGGTVHSLALKSDGTLWACGNNFSGCLGDGTVEDKLSLVQVGTNFKTISAGYLYSLGVKTDGSLWAWGLNTKGQLGDNTNENRLIPTQIGQ